jgi:hypothetical protein
MVIVVACVVTTDAIAVVMVVMAIASMVMVVEAMLVTIMVKTNGSSMKIVIL